MTALPCFLLLGLLAACSASAVPSKAAADVVAQTVAAAAAPAGQGLRWEALAKGQAPPANALRGGYISSTEANYVARLWQGNAILPGHVHSEAAYSVWNGAIVRQTDGVEVLLVEGERLVWVPSSHGRVPEGAVQAGISDDSETLYSCRLLVRNDNFDVELQPGVLRPTSGVCNTVSHGLVSSPTYEVLVQDPLSRNWGESQ